MTEETLFAEAIEKSTPAERAEFLDAACAGDAALRQRVEALLQSHAREDFLKTPAIQRAAEVAGGSPIVGATEAEVVGDNSESALDFLVPSEKPDSLGRLGHYEVQQVIGRGGMGVVLRAFDEKLHRVVAIKVMAAQLATNATSRKRFIREAQAQAAVSHDHIVAIHAVEADSQLPYLAMQYISGMSLHERLDKNGPLQLHEILRIGMQTASALAAAHAQGLVHRDIKPANILLENGVERVKITDFGLARAATEASLTQSGVVAGTPQYMSPEQAEGKAIDQRTDLFSLGSVLYTMCTGRAPFRASGTMAVLKRVCEETPTPIRESNPDVPDWLVAIIDKLHAKDPAQRNQTAAEVAELLGQHLARVQHPSVVPLLPPSPGNGAGGKGLSPAQPRRRRLAVAAAVFLCFLAGLGLTEATGVTNVRGTVIRIFTPDGTLVVETDDPGIKITIEGDGGLIITGAGLEEIRLRPGSYKVHADRDGKRVPLERELVSISRGGREVVKVKLENSPAPGAAQAAKGAFVLLAAGQERKFDSLAEAVLVAGDRDTVEIRGNGPYLVEPIHVGDRALILRAGQGFRPTLQSRSKFEALLTSNGPLVLEGIEFVRRSAEGAPGEKPFACLIHSRESVLHVANCRFVENRGSPSSCVIADGTNRAAFRNSEFLHREGGSGILLNCPPTGTLRVENCIDAGSYSALNLSMDGPPVQHVSVALRRNTWAARNALFIVPVNDPLTPREADAPWQPRLSIEAAQTLFACSGAFVRYSPGALPPQPLADAVRGTMSWRDEQSLYPVKISVRAGPEPVPSRIDGIAAWDRLWDTQQPGSLTGRPRFQGGDLDAIATEGSERLKPDDFRLRPDSPGYRAGKDGKDLGADVDLVGPGPAYERWKKTPEYQQWLKQTGQVKGK
jgi:hypothetical protein